MALFGGRRTPGRQKGWMNRTLQEDPVPAIWITNETDSMDPAFLRRFLLPVALVTPPRSVRRQMAERHLGDCGLSPALLDELAEDDALAPARRPPLGGAAPRRGEHGGDGARGVGPVRALLHGASRPARREPAYLNLGGGVSPSALVQALA